MSAGELQINFVKNTCDVMNLDTTEMLDVTWGLFSKYFKPEEVNIKKELVDQHWKKQ
jgi:vacuolar-type H+-ATPase subunit B/Vma2